MPAIGHCMDLLRGQMAHILGATARFFDPVGNGRAIRPKFMGVGRRCNAKKTYENNGTHRSLPKGPFRRVNATPLARRNGNANERRHGFLPQFPPAHVYALPGKKFR